MHRNTFEKKHFNWGLCLFIFALIIGMAANGMTAQANGDGMFVEYQTGDTDATDNHIRPHFKIVNGSQSSVDLAELTVRYWYTKEGSADQEFYCDWAQIGCSNVTGTFRELSEAVEGTDHYLEVSFASGAGSLAPDNDTGPIFTRFHKVDWSNFDETDDYSYDSTKTSFEVWDRITVYQNGNLIWGIEPDGVDDGDDNGDDEPVIPNAPDGVVASPGNGQAHLSWKAVRNADSYNVKRATGSGGPYITVATAITETRFTDSSLENGTTYYYVISALNSVGESEASLEVSVTPQDISTGFTPKQFVEALSPGWNLGNTLDAVPTEGSWNNPPVEEQTFDDIKAAGFKSIRLPVTWDSHIGSGPNYEIDEGWMDRVEEVTDWALARDFYVVLNVHHDSWLWVNNMGTDHTGTLDKFGKVWTQIADRFKDKSDRLIFEIINEPTGMSAYQLNVVNQEMLDVIRNSGGYNDQRSVVVGGLHDNHEELINTFVVPEDDNLILTFHYYSPWDYVAGWWGNTSWGTEQEIQTMKQDLESVYNAYVTQGYPVLIGEYGTLGINERASKWLYHDQFVSMAYEYDMLTMWWDNGFDHFDRINRVWRDPGVADVIVNAGLGRNNSLLAMVDVYVEDGTTPDDVTIDIRLNGNSLEGIYEGSGQLTEGTDYTYNPDAGQVILDGGYISGLLQPGQLDLNAQLRFEFSEGADQVLDINQHGQPQVQNNTYTINVNHISGDLHIPVELNGTKLATALGVVDSTGRPILADEWSWTPYMNYNDDYAIEDGDLILRERLLNFLAEDSTVTFEFFPEGITLDIHLEVVQ
ncbi:Aryl-phospho-beta-D-glucosidase BglC, GH1 family [Evansella caseinilytica]|uniref:cellulase n=1 Tax=Evansella caseinilytica TaxID=1503961 RepID=A0A1H3PYF7_9BACI|nr:cellulase family glycosylhydrolase [Evansella caseinilytica]SDZ05439.1 Aryl-phospho-beta-D-glucosidase BglC, GH1 family [Evansella caseinilytica]